MGKCMAVFFFFFFFVIALDITAAIFGWKAQQIQNKHMKLPKFENKNPCQVAYALGLASISFLVIAHVLANFAGCYRGYADLDEDAAGLIMGCLLFTWLFMGFGLWELAQGVLSIHKSRETCGFPKNRYLYAGSWTCIYHAIAAFVTFVCIYLQPEEDTRSGRAASS